MKNLQEPVEVRKMWPFRWLFKKKKKVFFLFVLESQLIKAALYPKNAKICKIWNLTFQHRQWHILVLETAWGVKKNHCEVVERSLNSSSRSTEEQRLTYFCCSCSAVCCHESWKSDRFAMRMLFFAGAVCLHPRCHFGGMSLWWYHHSCQSAPLRVLRHEPAGPADQLQPH